MKKAISTLFNTFSGVAAVISGATTFEAGYAAGNAFSSRFLPPLRDI